MWGINYYLSIRESSLSLVAKLQPLGGKEIEDTSGWPTGELAKIKTSMSVLRLDAS
jgi:hypothetical protein